MSNSNELQIEKETKKKIYKKNKDDTKLKKKK